MNSVIEQREKIGTRVCAAGIAVNVVLFALKFMLGTLVASIAVVADAFNNLADAASSVVTIVGFKISGKKPNAKHPFGYGRIEYISALAVSFLILMTGITFLKDSVMNCIHPETLSIGIPIYIGLGLSIAAKIGLGLYTRATGRKIKSVSLIAAGTDSINDVIVTAATVVSMLVFSIFKLNIDGYIGIIVSVLILKAGIEVLKESLAPLLGETADPDLAADIEKAVLSGEGISGVHDLVVHNYGPGRIFASAHAEVPSDCDILKMHDIIDCIEADVRRDRNVELTIHFDPIDIRSEEVAVMRNCIGGIVHSVDSDLTFHDFRMVTGPTHTNLIFDIVYPYNCTLSEETVLRNIREKINALDGKYFAVIHIDYPHS